MKKIFKSRLSVGLAVTSLVLAAQMMAPVAHAETVTLKISHQNPAASSIHDGPMKAFMAAVEERSGGSIKTEYYPAEMLVKAAGGLAAVRKGVADIQTVVTSYHGDVLPVSNLYMLPGAHGSAEDAATNFLQDKAAYIQPELDRLGVKLVGVYIGSPYVLYSHKEIKNLSDLKGLKVRSPGAVMSHILNDAGASPVSLSAASMYDAMQKRTVDVAAHTIGYLGDVVKIYETAGSKESYVANAGPGGFGTFVVLMLMGNDTWNKMDKEQQKIVQEEGHKLGLDISKKYDAQDAVGKERILEHNGTIVDWDGPARAELQAVIDTAWKTEAKKVDELGFKGSELVAKFKTR
jgi:TRAP-type C4-dicarboxylate transport system substrate-binding protein